MPGTRRRLDRQRRHRTVAQPVLVAVAIALGGCAGPGGQDYVDRFVAAEPDLARLRVCHGYACANITEVAMSDRSWGRIAAVFEPPPADAAAERMRIAQAVALTETIVGPITGIDADTGRSSLFPENGYQLDCIDETVNTTTYLRAMEQRSLFRFHRVAPAARRGYVIDGWPHNTAVLEEIATGDMYTVDSWFHANGALPEIVPLDLWLSGWSPDTSG